MYLYKNMLSIKETTNGEDNYCDLIGKKRNIYVYMRILANKK